MWDDYQSTLDRLEYRLHLGHIIGAIALSKPRKLSVQGDTNDADFYTVYLQYDNPELDVEGGILYENQWRAPGQQGEFQNQPGASGYTSHFYMPALNPAVNPNQTLYPLATSTPWPKAAHILDVYLKKTVSYFTFGGEVTWGTGSSFDYNADGRLDSFNAFGVILNASYEYHKFKVFTDFLYASGDADLGGGHLNGFVLLNRNRRPGLILGRELLGPYAGNTVGLGGCDLYGNPNSYSGCIYLRPGLRFDWNPSWSSGLEVIFARKAATQAGEAANLGIEFDLGTSYAVYQNFDVGVNLGYLFAGDGLRVPNASGVLALRATATLKF
jgi:hypothetical protein